MSNNLVNFLRIIRNPLVSINIPKAQCNEPASSGIGYSSNGQRRSGSGLILAPIADVVTQNAYLCPIEFAFFHDFND